MKIIASGLNLLCINVIVIGLIFTGASHAQGFDSESVLGVWLFDEGDDDIAEDSSGNENHGIFKGNPKWVEGQFGNALEFDGASAYLDCGNNEILNVGLENFSLVTWIRCADYTPTGWYAMVLCKMDHTVPYTGYRINIRGDSDATNKEKPHVVLGSKGDSGANLYGKDSITDDEWHHLAVTVNREEKMKMYRDGNLEAEMSIASFSDKSEDNISNLFIGSRGTAGFYKGSIDETAVIKTLLSESQIRSIMTMGLDKALTAVSQSGKLTTLWGSIKTQ